jgi:hypothetical protein
MEILLICQSIYNCPTFQCYTYMFIDSRVLVCFTAEVVLFLGTGKKPVERIIYPTKYMLERNKIVIDVIDRL